MEFVMGTILVFIALAFLGLIQERIQSPDADKYKTKPFQSAGLLGKIGYVIVLIVFILASLIAIATLL